jgi:hypothetical protein
VSLWKQIKIMKIITLILSVLLIACTSKDITPTTIVGKWNPTYITQTKQSDGNFEPWHTINTLVALPVYEFTNDGRFLRDGNSGATCCNSGNNYYILKNEIIFSDLLSCPTVKCAGLPKWTIIEIKDDTLILEEFNTRNKYVKIK